MIAVITVVCDCVTWGVVRQAIWHDLGAASGCSLYAPPNACNTRLAADHPPDTCPNVGIWCAAQGCAKSRKVCPKKVLTFSGDSLLAVCIDRSVLRPAAALATDSWDCLQLIAGQGVWMPGSILPCAVWLLPERQTSLLTGNPWIRPRFCVIGTLEEG